MRFLRPNDVRCRTGEAVAEALAVLREPASGGRHGAAGALEPHPESPQDVVSIDGLVLVVSIFGGESVVRCSFRFVRSVVTRRRSLKNEPGPLVFNVLWTKARPGCGLVDHFFFSSACSALWHLHPVRIPILSLTLLVSQRVAGGTLEPGGRDRALHLPRLPPAVPRTALERSSVSRRKGRTGGL